MSAVIDKKAAALIRLIERIRELVDNHFFGELQIKLERGQIVHIKKVENIKP